MNWKEFMKSFAVQFFGQLVLGALAWYWFSLGVATTALVVANVLIVAGWVLGWSWLIAYGLGAPGQWPRAMVAVLLIPWMGQHVALAIVIPFLCLVVLFPSGAARKWKLMLAPANLGICLAMVLGMAVLPAALLNWIPAAGGLNGQIVSFGLRSLLAYVLFVAGWAGLLQYLRVSGPALETTQTTA